MIKKTHKTSQVALGHALVIGFETKNLVRAIARRIINQCVVSSYNGDFRTLELSRVLISSLSRHPPPGAGSGPPPVSTESPV